MEREYLLYGIRNSLRSIVNQRFYETERGFQGALLTSLSNCLPLLSDILIEQEYQKRLYSHGLNIRPDIIIHEPFKADLHEDRRSGNYAVIELKLRASRIQALRDFDSLLKMVDILEYPLAIFININSYNLFIEDVPAALKDKLVLFGIKLEGDKVCLSEYPPTS